MNFRIQLYTMDHRTRFMPFHTPIFGADNAGVVLSAENEKEAAKLFNDSLPLGKQFNPFYLKITKV